MRITKKTRTKDILPLLTKEKLDELLEKVEPVQLEKTLMGMSIAEFNDVINDEDGYLLNLINSNPEALVFLGKLKSFRTQIDGLNNFFKRLEVKMSPEETAATKGVMFPDIIQKMLLTCCSFFHLKSFEEAESCKVSDYMLIYQNEAASAQYQRNYQKIMEQKQKNKAKR